MKALTFTPANLRLGWQANPRTGTQHYFERWNNRFWGVSGSRSVCGRPTRSVKNPKPTGARCKDCERVRGCP